MSIPGLNGRIAGLFYLLTFVTAGPVAVVNSRLVVSDNAAATATNILAHEPLFLVGFAFALITIVCYIVVTALFYHLFQLVNKSVSLTAAFFSLMGLSTQVLSSAFYLAPLVVLGGAPYLAVFNVEQLHALALLFLKLSAQAYNVGLVFFGLYCLLIGYLVFRSTFLPRLLGALMALGGLAWLTFLSPPLAHYLAPYNLVPGIVGEGSLTLWLLIKGVNVQRWNQQAVPAAGPGLGSELNLEKL